MKKSFLKFGVMQLIMAVFFSSVFTSTSLALDTSADVFSDVSIENDNYTAIKYLKDNKVVQGYVDGNYRPKSKINRAEFLKIVLEASKNLNSASLEVAPHDGLTNCFKDVKEQWFATYVCVAAKQGIVKGYDDGYFRPEQQINFAEASKIVVNVMELEIGEPNGENWYQPYVKALEKGDVIPNDIYSFGYNITRGQMAEMIWRIREEISYKPTLSYRNIKDKQLAASTGGKLQNFSSCLDLKDYLESNSDEGYNYKMFETMDVMSVPAAADDAVEDSAMPVVSEGLGSAAGEYSATNVQVQGVDEADIVKNDGKYIYIVKDNSVRIVQAYPAAEMKELDRISFSDKENFYPSDLYVDGNRLVVIGSAYMSLADQPYAGQSKMAMPIVGDNYYYGSVTKVYIFDINDKAAIKPFRDLSYEGNYTSSRKVGDMVYLVVNKPEFVYKMPKSWTEHEILPLYKDSSSDKVDTVTGCTDVLYLPGTESTNYIVVAGIPTTDAKAQVVEEVVVGSGGEIFASRDNLYVAEQKYNWLYFDGNENDQEQTIVHKFGLDPQDIKYFGKGEVPGHILNQFSMDEHEGNFRIATTIGQVWNSDQPSKNNVYVLDSNLKRIGNLEGLAPGETIYSVRFMGDRVYMVTFKKIDPFFVIDLSVPSSPKVLGKLKIPGYSDYLHPYDENHIIGFGKEAVDPSELEKEGWGGSFDFAWYQGMKVAMFDVTDVANPVEMFKINIGDRGTDSPLLTNHKALLFDKNKGLMAFPVTVAEIPQAKKDDPNTSQSAYGDYTFQGAYVYSVSLDKGFELKGKISHYTENEIKDKAGYYWYGDKDIQRILYMGEYLYTVSQAMVKGNNLSDLAEVKSLELVK